MFSIVSCVDYPELAKPKRERWLMLQVIKKQMEEGVSQRRVGFISKGAPARQHSEIQTPDGEKVLYILIL